MWMIETKLFSVVTRNSAHKLQIRTFRWIVELITRVVKHWSRLPRKAMGLPSLDICKGKLDRHLTRMFLIKDDPVLNRVGLDQWGPNFLAGMP